MPNPNTPNGFRAVKSLTGASPNFMLRVAEAAVTGRSTDTTNNHGDIYVGDPIKLDGDGRALPANSNDQVAGVVVGVGTKNVTHGPAGAFKPVTLEQRYLKYDETGFVWYVPTRSMLFEIQTASDLDLMPSDLADFNLVAATAHGSRTTGLSNVQLVANGNSDTKVVENDSNPDNDVTAANARHYVMFVDQQF